MAGAPAPLPFPRRVTFVTNPDTCNLDCAMCREHSPLAPARPRGTPPRELAPALVLRVVEEGRGSGLAEVIPSTKGEPLLWEGLEELALLCGRLGVALNVTTNGTFPRLGGAGWAERLAPVASDVKVSWNGATPATAARLMGGLQLDAAVADVRAFIGVRDRLRASGRGATEVSFQVTAQEANVDELPGIVRLAADLGVSRVKVNQLQVHFAELAGEDLRRSPASRERWNRAVHGMRQTAETHLLPRGEPVRLQNVIPWEPAGGAGSGEPPLGACPFLGREAWVTVDGRFAPCPAPAGQDGRLGDFGSLHERPLRTIWEGEPYRALVLGYEARAPCRSCPFRRAGGF